MRRQHARTHDMGRAKAELEAALLASGRLSTQQDMFAGVEAIGVEQLAEPKSPPFSAAMAKVWRPGMKAEEVVEIRGETMTWGAAIARSIRECGG